jgi:hypothetical protein
LPDELGVPDGVRDAPQNTERQVANLVTVAVGAVEDVPSPTLTKTRDVGDLVAKPRRDQDSTGPQGPARVEPDVEPRVLVSGRRKPR